MAGGTASSGYADDDENSLLVDINVTPLVDITLVLLIIFMVTATYIVKPGIPVDLPKAASAGQTIISKLALKIDKTGAVSMNGAVISEEDLITFIKRALAVKPDLEATIAADQAASHGRVVHVMDVVRLAGVNKFTILAERVKRG